MSFTDDTKQNNASSRIIKKPGVSGKSGLELYPRELYFGALVVGEDQLIRTFSVTNVGSRTLRIENIEIQQESDQFVLLGSFPELVHPGDSFDVGVKYQSDQLGLKVGTVVITTNEEEYYLGVSGRVIGSLYIEQMQDGFNALILQESMVRADADSAEASSRLLMRAELEGSFAAQIEEERFARVTYFDAEVVSRQQLSVTLNDLVMAQIDIERQARVDGDSAEASAREALVAEVTDELNSALTSGSAIVEAARVAAELAATSAEESKTLASTYKDDSLAAATAASGSATLADGHRSSASSFSSLAATYASDAEDAAFDAANSASIAETAKVDANSERTMAEIARNLSALYRDQSESFRNSAETQAGLAETSRVDADASKASASASATLASSYASGASGSASAAAASATAASGSATSASGSAATATTQAGLASTYAGNANTSATNASNSATNASNSAASASTSATLSARYSANRASGNLVLKNEYEDNSLGGWIGTVSVLAGTAGSYTKVLRSQARDAYENTPDGGYTRWAQLAGSARKFRCRGYAAAPGAFPCMVGVHGINAAGTNTWQYAQARAAATGSYAAFDFIVTVPSGYDRIRPFVQSNNDVGSGSHDVRVVGLSIEDVTDVNDLEATVTTQAGTLADHTGKLEAYWDVTAVAGGRAKLKVYADSNGGGGVDIEGDTRISGNLIVDGTIINSKLPNSVIDQPKLAVSGKGQCMIRNPAHVNLFSGSYFPGSTGVDEVLDTWSMTFTNDVWLQASWSVSYEVVGGTGGSSSEDAKSWLAVDGTSLGNLSFGNVSITGKNYASVGILLDAGSYTFTWRVRRHNTEGRFWSGSNNLTLIWGPA